MSQDFLPLWVLAGAAEKPEREEKASYELMALKANSQRWITQKRHRPRLSSGIQEMDGLLGGGWPLGAVGELVGPCSSGKTSVAVATVAQATRRGELCLWVDVSGELDATSLAAWQVPLEAILVVRAAEVEQAMRSVELVLPSAGFTVAVVDLGRQKRSSAKAHLPLRLARAVERAGGVGLVLTESPWMGTWAGVQVVFSQAQPRFRKGDGSPPWFAGWQLAVNLRRGGVPERKVAWAMGA